MQAFPASLLGADSESPAVCLRPSEEKLSALALSIGAERGELAIVERRRYRLRVFG